MRLKRIGAIVALTASTAQCHGALRGGEQACRVVQGELSAWNGTPSLRIVAAGQTFGIVRSQMHPLPPSIASVNFRHSAIGRFTVCQVGQAKPNGMIYVWLKRAENLKLVAAP
jgi:hypothetical protein